MRPLAIIRSGTIGDDANPLSNGLQAIANDVQASARAQLYQYLADFQALPLRINRLMAQLGALEAATPTRSLEESARLDLLLQSIHALQGQWSAINDRVTSMIAALSANGATLGTVGQASEAIAGMTLLGSATGSLEGDVRGAIAAAGGLSDGQRQQLYALGAPASQLITFLKWSAGAVGLYFVGRALLQRRRR